MHRLPVLVAISSSVILLLGGCASDQPERSAATGDDQQIGHIHGLGIDPADGALYAAGHLGVFKIENGTPTRIANRWQDTMAFTVTGPHTFLGSGHPDLNEDLPPHLGLIESTDAAKTWKPLSLQGEADFHALEVVGNRVFGYDSNSSQILATTDRTTWKSVTEGEFIDLASSSGKTDQVLATTGAGELVRVDLGGQTTKVADAPRLVWIDATPRGVLVGTGPDGKVYTADSATGDWINPGSVTGQPEALDATDTVWHVATDTGIYASEDQGATWSKIVEIGQ
ncbi:F510_1955 family glycosylhydrolase [Nocardioides sp. NPDC057767]|jgi:photosystem II stability/assembly factor-like uncharacterized protein|uniref:BNR/Asp-box repeat protein n=1 Tax=Nocardioides albertanoniae TaxID=1175486 RepID=A0A543A3U1_9ACTN|nr:MULTISPECIES: hypothetical protein [Nocardioides]TQL67232.1 hypothetical protein FB381_1105 [Nocardioides albertanoniae]